MKPLIFLLLLSVSFAGCSTFEYSPNQVFDNESLQNINAKNIEKLTSATPNGDTIRFAITGDTQRSYDQIAGFINTINSIPNLDFLTIAGDLSEFGLLKEMEWIEDGFSKLNIPYIAVIGNHDLVARGSVVFQRMFGELNYSFTYNGTKFLCHNTNSREYNFNGKAPDIEWIKKELQPQEGVRSFVAISHVPPISSDFDPKLINPYTSLFLETEGFLGSFYGHTHNFEEFSYQGSNVLNVITSAIEKREFLLVTIVKDSIHYERIFF